MNKHLLHNHTSGAALGRAFLTAVLFASLGSSVQAEKFFLASKEGGEKYGPFEFREGEKVVIGKKTFVVKKLRTTDDSVIRADDAYDLEKKLKSLIIPEMDVRQAVVGDVIAFLKEAGIQFDKTSPKERRGVNIILNINGIPADQLPLVTFSARHISLLQAINILTQVTGLSYRFEENVVFIELKK